MTPMMPRQEDRMESPDQSIRPVPLPDTTTLERAREAVFGALAPTPLIDAGACWLKLETLQPTGSFKVRGVIAALTALPPGSELVAASAGNHALGIAWASERLGLPATVVIAETASPAKRAWLEARPVTLIRFGQEVVEAEAYAIDLVARSREPLVYVSPYNDPNVIAGQSTLLDEIVAVTGSAPIRVVVPLGGGGLLAGIGLRAAILNEEGHNIEVIGVEVSASRAVSAAVAAGSTMQVPVGDTIADGLSGNIEPGSITVELIRKYVSRLEHVPDAAVRAAIRTLAVTHGLVTEGAGATAFAAVQTLGLAEPERRTIAIVSGRNILPATLATILTESPATAKDRDS
jgi:threonine dehydratase